MNYNHNMQRLATQHTTALRAQAEGRHRAAAARAAQIDASGTRPASARRIGVPGIRVSADGQASRSAALVVFTRSSSDR